MKWKISLAAILGLFVGVLARGWWDNRHPIELEHPEPALSGRSRPLTGGSLRPANGSPASTCEERVKQLEAELSKAHPQ